MAQARAAEDYQRFLLITEDTVPLLTPAALLAALRAPVEYMNVYTADEAWTAERYGFYYFDQPTNSPRGTAIGDWRITDEVLADLARLAALKRRGKFPLRQLYISSTWWGLSAGALAAIEASYQDDEHLRESFEFSAPPEEHYFVTILKMRAPLLDYKPFIHVDFSRQPRPYIYTAFAELAALQASPALFTRKAALGNGEVERFVSSLC